MGSLEATVLLGKAHYLDGEKDEAEVIFKGLHQRASPEEKNETALWIILVYKSLEDYQKGHEWVKELVDVPIKET